MTFLQDMKKRLPEPARAGLRSAADVWHWLTRVMPHNPPMEIYLSLQGRRNHRFHRRIMAQRARPAPEWPRAEIPKTIWTYWAQGEAEAPDIIHLCLDSWRRRNPGWEVRCLDARSASELVDFSYASTQLPKRFQSDTIRLKLLEYYGGVWADCTSYCHRPLDNWLPYAAGSGFFVFSAPGPSRWFDNWFIAGEAGGPLISAWSDAYSRYVRRATNRHRTYFAMIYVLQWQMLRDRALREAWERVPRLPANPCFILGRAMMDRVPLEAAEDALRAGLPVSKLSWKAPMDLGRLRHFLRQADRVEPIATPKVAHG